MSEASRTQRLRDLMKQEGISALLVSKELNRRYVSGFTGSAGYLLITMDKACLLTDFRYTEQAEEQAPDFHIHKLVKGLLRELPDLQKEIGFEQLWFESDALTYKTYSELATAAAEIELPLHPCNGLVEALRIVKNAAELELIQRAIVLADNAVTEVGRAITPGMTELQIAWDIEMFMRRGGAEGLAFEVIVGSGPRGAMPHARAGERKVEPGDPVVLDLGCIVDGYRSDLTRTICIGEPSKRYLEIWNLVRDAQQAAFDGIQPGMTAGAADALAREVIAAAGDGEQFGHSLGHGIGLETHEAPYVRNNGDEILREGMVFSVEPGIYLPGEFGVRIEDLVLLEAGGVRVLSQAPKAPVSE